MFSIEDALDAVPAGDDGSAALLTIERTGQEAARFRRLRTERAFGIQMRETVRTVLAGIQARLDAEFEPAQVRPYEWGRRFSPEDYGAFEGGVADLAPRLNAAARGGAGQDPDRELASPDDHVRAYALTVQSGNHRVTVVRRRDPLQRFAPDRLLGFWEGDEIRATRYVFAYDGGWDAILMDDDALIANPAAFEALFGTQAAIMAALEEVTRELAAVIPDETMRNRLTGDLRARERLRRLSPGFAERLRSGQARRAIDRFELDGVRIDRHGNLTFGGSNAARAQVLRLLEDGFLLSEVSDQRYSARDKDGWPARRLVAGVRRADGRIVSLTGDGEWSPITVEEAAADIAANRFRYAVSTEGGPVAITRRVRGGAVSLTAYEDAEDGARVDRLGALPEAD